MKNLFTLLTYLLAWSSFFAQTPDITCLPDLTVEIDLSASMAIISSDLCATSSDAFVGIKQTTGITPLRSLWAWGDDFAGQLGDGGGNVIRSSPVSVGSATNWMTIAAGFTHSLGIRTDGSLWAWGSDGGGAIGDGPGTNPQNNRPIPIALGIEWIDVAASLALSLGIRKDGTLWAWGLDLYGQLGDGGSNTNQHWPVKIGTATNWVKVSAGVYHVLALRADGTLWSWGNNIHGQLGHGPSQPHRNSPKQVGTATNWVAISAGGYHSFGIQDDGSLWAWGLGGSGQLGLGNTSTKPSPTRVGSATDWVAIAATGERSGRSHSLGLRANGTIWAWGSDRYGQLGNGTGQVNQSSPSQIGTATNWVAIDAGGYESYGIQEDGSLWAWGFDRYGQLGDGGSNTDQESPVQVGTGTDWEKIFAGNRHAIGIQKGDYSFPIGTHTLSFEAFDVYGNTNACSFTVTVEDDIAPTITCPQAIVQPNDPGTCSAVVNYNAPQGADNLSGATTALASGLGDGGTFTVGIHTETYTVTDASGNTATCSFTITVNDTEDPAITCPLAIVQPNDPGSCSAVVNYTAPQGTDNCASTTALSSGQGDGGTFPIGTHTETYTVTDAAGNTASCSFSITIHDTEKPTITCPQNISQGNDGGNCDAVVSYSAPTGADNCTGANTILTSGLGDGGTFPIGAHTETYTVSDASGNSATCSFTITVNDTENPTFACPTSNVIRNTDQEMCDHLAIGNDLDPVVADDCQLQSVINDYTQSNTLGGAVFPKGKTLVTWTATDIHGNSGTCSYHIKIRDREAPVFDNCPDDSTIIVPAYSSGSYFTFPVLTASDNCNPANKLTISGFPLSGSFCAVGVTTFSWTTTDKANNAAPCQFDVTVEEMGTPTPNGWSDNNVGNGNGCHTNYDPVGQRLTLQSTGGNVSMRSDNFCGITIPNSDQAIDFRARVTPAGNGYYDQAGIMMRQGLASNSKHATMLLTGTSVPMMTMRASTGGFPMSTAGTAVSKPYWLRLYRLGGSITGYISADGVNWSQIMAYPNLLSSPLYLVLFSTTSGTSGQATFDNISINGIAARLGEEHAISTDLSLKAYPNPFSEDLFIEVSNALPGETYQVRVSNMLGQRVYGYETGASDGGKLNQRISLAHLAPGTYLLEVSAGVQRRTLKVRKF